jgi:hypothetical protein
MAVHVWRLGDAIDTGSGSAEHRHDRMTESSF